MSLLIRCRAGHKVMVAGKYAGRIIRCPKCQVEIDVPLTVEPSETSESYQLSGLDAGLDAAQKAADESPLKAPPKTESPKSESPQIARSPGRRRWLLATTAIALLSSIAVGGWMLRGRGDHTNSTSTTSVSLTEVPQSTASVPNAESVPESATVRTDASSTTPAANESEKLLPSAELEKRVPGTIITLVAALKSSFAFDPASGDLAVVEMPSRQLWIYRSPYFGGELSARSGPVADLDEIDAKGSKSVAFKPYGNRQTLLVGANQQITVLDATSLLPFNADGAFANPISVSWPFNHIATSQSVDDPHVLLFQRSDQRTQWIDLWSGGRSQELPDDLEDATVARSGRFIQTQYRHDASGTCLALPVSSARSRVPLPRLELSDTRGDAPITMTSPCIDPWERFVVTQAGALRIGSMSPPSRLPGTPLCVLEKFPWIVTLDEKHLRFVHRDSMLAERSVALPELFQVRQDPYKRFVVAFDDPLHERLMIAQSERVWVIPYSELSLPTDRFLATQVALKAQVVPGQPLDLQLRFPAPNITATLHNGPAGAAIDSGRLRWTPTREQIGIQHLTVRLKAGDDVVDQQFTCSVNEPEVVLPFAPTQLALSPDGRRAAVWMMQPWPAAQDLHYRTRLCVVDLHARRVIAQREFPRIITTATLSTDQVFVLSEERNAFQRDGNNFRYGSELIVLNAADLAPIRSLFLRSPAHELHLLNEQLLIVRMARGDTVCFQLPKLEVSPLGLWMPYQRTSLDTPAIQRISSGWSFGHIDVDEQLRPQSLRPIPPFLTAIPSSGGVPPSRPPSPIPQLKTSMNQYSPGFGNGMGTLIAHDNKRDRNPNGSRDQDQKSTVVKAQFHAGPGPAGPAERTIPLFWVPEWENNFRALTAGRSLSLIHAERLFTFDLETLGLPVPAATAEHLSLSCDSVPPIVSDTESQTIRLIGRGGQPPYRFVCRIGEERPGLPDESLKAVIPEADSDSFRLDGAKIKPVVINELTRTLSRWPGGSVGTVTQVVNDYLEQANQRLRSLTDHAFRDVPILIPLNVSVTDAGSKSAGRLLHFVWEMPRSEFETLLNTAVPRATAPLQVANEIQNLRPRFDPADPLAPEKWTAQRISQRIRSAWPRRNIESSVEVAQASMEIARASAERTGRANVPLDDLMTGHGHAIGNAMLSFHDDYGCFPPPALVNDHGEPLLSWRVLLLPYMGHANLFTLFHLDEPWDSDHNRRLLPFRPAPFVPSEKAAAKKDDNDKPIATDRTSLLAFVGPRFAFDPNFARRMSDFPDGGRTTLFFTDVADEFSVEWTKPADLNVTDDSAWKQPRFRVLSPYKRWIGVFGTGHMSGDRDPPSREKLIQAAQIDDGQK